MNFLHVAWTHAGKGSFFLKNVENRGFMQRKIFLKFLASRKIFAVSLQISEVFHCA